MGLGAFRVEYLGLETPSSFTGHGVAFTRFDRCAYGVGDTEGEALEDCLEMAVQTGLDIDETTEKAIRAAYGPVDEVTTARKVCGMEEEEGDDCGEEPLFHVGIKWNTPKEVASV